VPCPLLWADPWELGLFENKLVNTPLLGQTKALSDVWE